MPAKSAKQEKFMQAIANNPAFAKKAGVPQSVGKEFTKSGGGMATKGVNPFAKFEKSGKDVEKKGVKEGSKQDMAMDKKQMGMPKFAKGGVISSKMGAVKTAAPSRDGIAVKGKTKGKMITMSGNKGMKSGGKC